MLIRLPDTLIRLLDTLCAEQYCQIAIPGSRCANADKCSSTQALSENPGNGSAEPVAASGDGR